MAKVQSRRVVSMNRKVFERLKAYCAGVPVPVAALVEQLVVDHIAHVGVEVQTAAQGVLRANAVGVRDRAVAHAAEHRRAGRVVHHGGVREV